MSPLAWWRRAARGEQRLTRSDKSTPPSYERKRIPGDDDTELLIFTAGPPYEDVAFRIVRKQWDYSHRRGFRSHFDRGVLQLAFKFQRDTYRK